MLTETAPLFASSSFLPQKAPKAVVEQFEALVLAMPVSDRTYSVVLHYGVNTRSKQYHKLEKMGAPSMLCCNIVYVFKKGFENVTNIICEGSTGPPLAHPCFSGYRWSASHGGRQVRLRWGGILSLGSQHGSTLRFEITQNFQ
jgi:hypothetical protein